ncbi:hypothetical protein GCK72_006645 [Caenorhabditis remanei]|uniref:Uncharacterized protein n=1 Tax=Caenorhabditis remanei TaxID=31234 RepID=A0A6A5HJA6_CAERE|nr:hypothetical protein GCK72_006645 [Caenorhabditis remanei]KAF1766687.1 hypothetical protein GCK72_006645 [Caenorhabditis remanei]
MELNTSIRKVRVVWVGEQKGCSQRCFLGINRNYALQKLYDLNCPLSVYETCQTKQLIECAKLYECQSLIDLLDEKFEDLQRKELKRRK